MGVCLPLGWPFDCVCVCGNLSEENGENGELIISFWRKKKVDGYERVEEEEENGVFKKKGVRLRMKYGEEKRKE